MFTFHHFHKHSKKYLIFAVVTMMFALVTFSIPTALQAFTGSQTGRGGDTWIRFKTSSGQVKTLSLNEWQRHYRETTGFANLFPFFVSDLVTDQQSRGDLPWVQAILAAEADEMGVTVPDSMVEEWYQRYLEYLQARSQGQKITRGQIRNLFQSQQLSEDSFRRSMREALKTFIYRQSVQGVPIHNPRDIQRHFSHKNQLVSLEYVEFPFETYREQLEANPPSDEVLSTYYDEMEENSRRRSFSSPEKVSLDLALVDYDNFDAGSAPEEFLADYAEPDDGAILQKFQSDPIRYGTAPTDVVTAADIPTESREKILRDLKTREVMLKVRRQYEDFVASLALDAADESGSSEDADADSMDPTPESEDPTPAEAQDSGEDNSGDDPDEPAADEKDSLSPEEILEKGRLEFERLASLVGFNLQSLEERSRDELSELDPPKDPALPFIVAGLIEAGNIQNVEAARDRPFGYIIRLSKRTPAAPKTFEEAREDVLEQWLDENARKEAEKAANGFRDGIRAKASEGIAPEIIAAFEKSRDQERKEVEEDTQLSEAQKTTTLKSVETEFFLNLCAVLKDKEALLFAEAAKKVGLDLMILDYFRRSDGQKPYFRDQTEGAARFLKMQDSPYGTTPRLLGYAPDTVSEVLVDGEGRAAYVARILGRQEPPTDQMSPLDQQEAKDANDREFRFEQPKIAYLNPFSLQNLSGIHEPEVRIQPAEGEEQQERPEDETEPSN